MEPKFESGNWKLGIGKSPPDQDKSKFPISNLKSQPSVFISGSDSTTKKK